MARSSLLGVDLAPPEAPGRDKSRLGPGDSSDSGSDVVGLDGDDDADPGLPVDVALRDDQAAPLPLGESLPAGEGATGVRDGADIGVDRIFRPGEPEDLADLEDLEDLQDIENLLAPEDDPMAEAEAAADDSADDPSDDLADDLDTRDPA